VELETALAAAEREAAARQQQEKAASARRLREEQEAAARRAQEERAQEKIREAAKKPLPSFKDVMKKKRCAEAPKKEDRSQQISKPSRLSDARPAAVLKSSSDAREGAGSEKNGGEVFDFFLFFFRTVIIHDTHTHISARMRYAIQQM
jgi:hypothetical protein